MTMQDQSTYESIERYLSGEMQGQERAEFQARIDKDPVFSAEVRLHREIAETIADEQTLDFSALVADVVNPQADSQQLHAAPRRSRSPWLAIAAAVLLLALVGIFIFRSGGADPQALYTQHFSAYEAPIEFRGGDSTLAAIYETAFDRYQSADYPAAITEFETILQSNPQDLSARFYLSVSQLAEGRGSDAEQGFRDLLAADAPTWRSQSSWYLSLALLQQGKETEAKAELQKLSQGAGKYARLAAEVLAEM